MKGTVRRLTKGRPVEGLTVDFFEVDGERRERPNETQLRRAKRLGSAVTRHDGTFELEIDAPSPDAATSVVAAVRGLERDEDQRPLAVTFPRVRPGRVEEWLIEVPDERLPTEPEERPPRIAPPQPRLDAARTSIGHQRETAAKLRSGLSETISARLESRRKGRRLGARVLGRKGRGALGDGARFVPAGEDAEEILAKARARGVERLGMLPQRGMALRLTPDQLRELGLGSGGGDQTTVSLGELAGRLNGLPALNERRPRTSSVSR
jgi:hypothetical protein